MRSLGVRRDALGICVAVVLLSGCGGSAVSPAQGAYGMSAQSAGSWMLPEAKHEDLLYADSTGASVHYVYAFSYPAGKLVGTISEPDAAYQQGLCSDAKGDVFITTLSNTYYGGAVYEYAHGRTKPVRVLDEFGVWPWGCGVDPTTGNLAVASVNLASQASWVEVYQRAKGKPANYSDNEIINYTFVGYDDSGDLFIDGSGSGSNVEFGELRKGSGSLINVKLDKSIDCCGQVQWDGKYVTIEDEQAGAIYRLSFSGSTGTVVGTTLLKRWNGGGAQSWIQGNVLLQPNDNTATEIGAWPYPRGGNPTANISTPTGVFGVTVSLRP
ncbi:MAG: hypothetical protein WAK11_13980 [Candidatus Cybelea sp.]